MAKLPPIESHDPWLEIGRRKPRRLFKDEKDKALADAQKKAEDLMAALSELFVDNVLDGNGMRERTLVNCQQIITAIVWKRNTLRAGK
jgi:hypothetical protein